MLPPERNRISPPDDAEQTKEGPSELRGGQSTGREAESESRSRLRDSTWGQRNPKQLNRGLPGRHPFPHGGMSDPPLELFEMNSSKSFWAKPQWPILKGGLCLVSISL